MFGGANPKAKNVLYRNPKQYMKKSGDMSQKFSLRSKQMEKEPIFEQARKGYTQERYYGSDYYVRQYGALEMEAYAIKHPVPISTKGYIEKPPKGAEFMKSKRLTELKRYDTTYKQEYLEPANQVVGEDFAGLPLKVTNIGQL